jgi:MoaA/NifB/PqqE/SkfB family radical SAM enzyme
MAYLETTLGSLLEKLRRVTRPPNAVRRCLEKYLVSTLGDRGIAGAAGRMESVVGEVAQAVRAWEDGGDLGSLAEVLSRAVDAIDSHDLRDKEISLRVDLADYSGPGEPYGLSLPGALVDPAPRSCILSALIEAVEADEGKVDTLLSKISTYRNRRVAAQVDFNAALALSRRFIERGRFDDALDLLEGNFAVNGFCAASQYLGFKAYAGKEARGEIIVNKRINTDDLSRKFCSAPFEILSLTLGKRLAGKPVFYACGCAKFLPYPIHSTNELASIQDSWNGEQVRELRRSILDGDFKYCSRMSCGYLVSGQLPDRDDVTDPIMRDVIDNHKTTMDRPPRNMVLAHDASCNIACPSCRSGIVTSNNAERAQMDAFADRVLLPFLENAENGEIMLDICGDGDPFGSKHYRRIIHSLDPVRHKNVKLRLITNALLLTKREWEELGPIQDMILSISVSIDAASAPTYEYVRRPGKWSTLVENMEHLSSVLEKDLYKFYLSVNFIVQKANYREMPEFVRLAKSWKARRALFQRILNLSTYERDDYLDQDVTDHRHPSHEDFKKVLSDPILRDPIVNMWQLGHYASAAQNDSHDDSCS